MTDGYVAIVLPVLHDYEREMSKLLSDDDYRSVLAQRQATQPTQTAVVTWTHRGLRALTSLAHLVGAATHL